MPILVLVGRGAAQSLPSSKSGESARSIHTAVAALLHDHLAWARGLGTDSFATARAPAFTFLETMTMTTHSLARIFSTRTAALLITCALATATGCGQMTFNQKLAGHWVSGSCESAGSGSYIKRDFTLTESTWKLNATVYNDAACTVKFLGLDIAGPYTVVQESTAVAGATEVNYQVTDRRLIPLSDGAVQLLMQGKCGAGPWAVNQIADIAQTGCAPLGFPSNAQCPGGELDLNQIDGNNLFFGDRSADLCKARPTKLGSYPVTRAQ